MIKKPKKLYNYQVTTLKTNFDKIIKTKTKLYNIKYLDNFLVFNCNDLSLLTDIEIEVINLRKKRLHHLISNYCITSLGILFLFFMLMIIKMSITKVEFINEDYYNEEVYNYVHNKLRFYYKFAFLKDDINSINQDLRSTFYKYQWVGLIKKGTTLYIDIAKTTDIDNLEDVDKTPGGLYSKYNCIINSYYINKGKALIKPNKSVVVDEELISGEIVLYGGEIEYIRASGYVIGEVVEFQELEIMYQYHKKNRTGRIEVQKNYLLFGHNISKINSRFENYEVEYKEVYKLSNVYSLYQIIIYEVNETYTTYNETDAITYGMTLIRNNFISDKQYDIEYLKDITFVSIAYTNQSYIIKYISTKFVNIAYFKAY